MKKVVAMMLAGFITGASLLNYASAQTDARSISGPDFYADAGTSVRKPVVNAREGNLLRNEVNVRAVRDFMQRYVNAGNASWYGTKEGYLVFYERNALRCRSFYDKRGNWKNTMRTGKELQLPKEVRAIVKRIYYDYAITQFEEVTAAGAETVYVVHMEDDNTWLKVSVCAGEMEVIEEYRKQ